MRFNCLMATEPLRGDSFIFPNKSPGVSSWDSFHQPRKVEKLSRPWSHSVVLNTGCLHSESSALTTRPLLHKISTAAVWKNHLILMMAKIYCYFYFQSWLTTHIFRPSQIACTFTNDQATEYKTLQAHQRRIQNPVQHLRWNFLYKQFTADSR